MVKLIVSDYEQMTILEDALVQSNIPHIIEVGEATTWISPPCLLVDGVALDLCAGITWIAEHQN